MSLTLCTRWRIRQRKVHRSVLLDVGEYNSCGVVGGDDSREQSVREMVLDVAVTCPESRSELHCYRMVKVEATKQSQCPLRAIVMHGDAGQMRWGSLANLGDSG